MGDIDWKMLHSMLGIKINSLGQMVFDNGKVMSHDDMVKLFSRLKKIIGKKDSNDRMKELLIDEYSFTQKDIIRLLYVVTRLEKMMDR